jgi:hypothetical protein
MTDSERIAFLDAVGRETANVILAELAKIDGATTGDLLIAIESVVVHVLAAVEMKPAGKEGKLLKQMRENAMRRLAQRRVLEGRAQGRA